MSIIAEKPKEASTPGPFPIPPGDLAKIQGLYDSGLCLQAHRASEPFGPLKRWKGRKERTLAGRLAGHLGAHRLAGVLHWLAWRADPTDPDAAAYYGYTLNQRRGPLATLEFLEKLGPEPENAEADGVMHLLTLRALVASQLRDFAASEQYLRRAEEISPANPWVPTTRSYVLEAQDRYAEALEAAQRSLTLRPWYRPGVQAVAHALQLLDRDNEALAILTEASRHIENMHVVRQLTLLQTEKELYEEAEANLKRFAELAPMMEKAERQWLTRQQVTLDCLRGKREEALAGAMEIQEPYYQELAFRLQRDGQLRRVRLKVPFVRQHHLTCAPATLSAISRYWQRPAEHLDVAEAICYAGTPAHSERNWAETHGWVAREFRVTWESAVALLDRGIPFTLTTTATTSGHLQAVVGYDETRQTLWIRDPFVYSTNEFIVKPLLEQQRATGPRGMALVPMDRRELLEGLDLPEADLYDQLHRLEWALAQHRRADALEVCQKMQGDAPDHRLTLVAQRALAAYDGNRPALLQCLEALLKQFPDDGNLNLAKLSCLRDLARRDERLRTFEELCTRRGTDPIFWQQYAQELRADARQKRTAETWVRWALRYRPTDPALISAWADLLWDRRDFARARHYYRLAACLGDKVEGFSRSYFIASRHLRETDAALAFLRDRDERLGKKSGNPAVTLVESLQALRRANEAFVALGTALARRPEDGAFRLFAADFHGRFSRFETAGKMLRDAEPRCSTVAWHRTAAALAGYQNHKLEALKHWRAVLELEALAHDAIRSTALLLAETEGREVALQFLDGLCERFPFSCPLLGLRIQWLNEDGAEAVIPHIRRLLEVNPADAWAWRELALKLAGRCKWTEALEAATEAIRLEPNQSNGHSIRADILARNNRAAEGHADFREAVRLEVDNEYAVAHFVSSAPTLADRKQALEFVAGELRRQVIFGRALSAYQTAARGLLKPEEVTELLREAYQARPDLWQAWSVFIHQLVETGKYDEARHLATRACENFPLLPGAWVDLARVEQARLDVPGEIAALEKALELNPGFSLASRQLAAIHERQEELPKARTVLEAAVAANPLEAVNHGCLAQVLWKQGERENAISRVRHALRLHPGYEWGWNALREWGKQTGKPALAAEAARDLTRIRAGEARSWLLLANCLSAETEAEELFAALDHAVALNPRCEDAYDLRARALTRLGRFDEALAQCAPAAFPEPTAKLLVRAAWIEAQRGNLQKAIERAKSALGEHPNYYGGWQFLADWQVRANNLKEAVVAAQKMADLAPLQPVPLGHLGDLKQRSGDKAGARQAFARAFSLDPDYAYAGFKLFHLQLEARELDPAQQTLKVLQRRGENYQTITAAIELAGARQDWNRAQELFVKLCAQEKVELWALEEAAKVLDKNKLSRRVDEMLVEQSSTAQCGSAVGEFWVDRQIRKRRWNLHKRLGALKEKDEIGRRAILRYLDHMGEGFQNARKKRDATGPLLLRYHLFRLLRKHRSWLAGDIVGWGKVGYVLTCVGSPQPVIAWLGDWKTRPKAESWMLYNLILMLQRKRRYAESREVLRHAVTMRHSNELYETFRLWTAFEEALSGNVSQAEKHLATLQGVKINDNLRPLQGMICLLIDLSKQPEAERKKKMFKFVRERLRTSFGKTVPSKAARYVSTAYRRLLKVAGRESKMLWLWGWWYYRQSAWLGILFALALFLTLLMMRLFAR